MEIGKIDDLTQLDDFFCGMSVFDDFIHSDAFSLSIKNNFCVPYKVVEENKIIAFFALSCGSLTLDTDYLDDFLFNCSISEEIIIPVEYKETLRGKNNYPAIDIAYFAVHKDYRGKHFGKQILSIIEDMIKSEFKFAGCQFLILDAYNTNTYSTTTFYAKCNFTMCEMPKADSDTVLMYKWLI